MGTNPDSSERERCRGYSDDRVAQHASTRGIQHSIKGLCDLPALYMRSQSVDITMEMKCAKTQARRRTRWFGLVGS